MPDRDLIERDMDDYVVGENWPEPDPAGDPIPLPDPTAVSGTLRRLKRLAADADAINEVTDAEIRRLEQFRSDRLAGIQREIEWGERAVENFMRLFGPAAHKKSLPLADGTLKLSAPRDKVVVTNEPAFLAWAIGDANRIADPTAVPAHPELIRAKYSLVADATKPLARAMVPDAQADETIKRSVLALPDGTLVPGVEIHTEKEDTFKVTLGDD